MKALRYRIELEERVLAAGPGGDPNTVVTRPYLTGSLLRGAFIEEFLAGSDENLDLAANSDTRPLFFDSSVRYLNGYLVDEGEESASDRRMLPTPRSWRRKKDARQRFSDFAPGEPSPAPWTPPYQTFGEPFCVLPRPGEERGIWFGQPKEILKTHHQRPGGAERRGGESGDIYRHQSLSAGQTFEALVLCDEAQRAEQLLEWMGGSDWKEGGPTWSLGKSRTTQGRVQTRLLSVWDTEQDGTWKEAPGVAPPSRLDDLEGTLVVTLLSNLLARAGNGEFAAGPGAVTRALNQALSALDREERFREPERAYVEASRAGGFNREWGLHLPEANAVAMGSVLVYENPDLSPGALRALERRGAGARRAEGFGRVAFNLHGQSKELEVETDKERRRKTAKKRRQEGDGSSPPRELQDGTPSHAVAGQMAEQMLRHRLDLALDEAVARYSVRGNVPGSQIGRLRTLLQRALRLPKRERHRLDKERRLDEGQELDEEQSLERGRDLLREYIEDIKSRASARSRFEGAFVHEGDDTTPLLKWVRQRVEDGAGPDKDASIWDELLRDAEAPPAVGTVRAQLTDRLAYTYNLCLAEEVLARAGTED